MKRPAAQLLARRIESIWSPDRQWSSTRTEEWVSALEPCDEDTASAAIDQLRNNHDKCPSIAEVLTIARPQSTLRRSSHSLQCMCAGIGWIEVEQHDDHSTWMAWARCPHGLPTTFVEPEAEYDPVAGAAAYATFNALAATAETRKDLAAACFAAAEAYRNAEQTRLL